MNSCSCSRLRWSVAAALAELDCAGFLMFSTSELGLTSMVDLGYLFLSQRLAWYGLPTQYIQYRFDTLTRSVTPQCFKYAVNIGLGAQTRQAAWREKGTRNPPYW